MANGVLYLIPVPLSEDAAPKSFTPFLIDTINSLDEYIVENEKTARKFLKQAGLKIPQSALIIHDYGKHAREKSDSSKFFSGLKRGKDVGLMSEAGCPGVADPGADIVAEAHKLGIKVVPLVGPSSILLALMASGFSGQKFAFHGYLPIDKNERSKKIKELENQSMREKQTQIFIETPFRNNQLLEDIIKTCKPATGLCIACNVTSGEEYIRTRTVAEWKKHKEDYHKKPAIFLLYV
ncbi:SAM-dependent methyltransferase [Sphingobacterium thalpophilum]|uniref:Ribosomal RNA small subunit methyltransferase I n=1 Tax=Sphingobacterium thalpophilum TaxID=259 RepID=A0A4U9UQH5_9SPHI|nr:SAM-dependent methyltransferase [Sphingobacterium thalpophilum]VTR35906.1 Ribosomal RNA small subunit methyltransferase I [Sphingobacterium thalpophilum]